MSGSECSGRFVGLFDPDECAPGSKALAGNSLGYRGRAACKCEPESGLTAVKLMKEDFRVSESLGDPEVLLCGLCAEAYDERREELGCTQCGAALKQDLTIDPRFGGLASVLEGHCPSCAPSPTGDCSCHNLPPFPRTAFLPSHGSFLLSTSLQVDGNEGSRPPA